MTSVKLCPSVLEARLILEPEQTVPPKATHIFPPKLTRPGESKLRWKPPLPSDICHCADQFSPSVELPTFSVWLLSTPMNAMYKSPPYSVTATPAFAW